MSLELIHIGTVDGGQGDPAPVCFAKVNAGLSQTVEHSADISANAAAWVSLSTDVSIIETQVGENTVQVAINTQATIDIGVEVDINTSELAAQGSSIQTLDTNLSSLTTYVDGVPETVVFHGTSIANIETKVDVDLPDAISANATTISTQQSEINGIITYVDGVPETVDAHVLAINTLQTQVEVELPDAISANATTISTQQSEINGIITYVDGVPETVDAHVLAINTLQTQVEVELPGDITANATAIFNQSTEISVIDGRVDQVNATTILKVDANGKVAQMSLNATGSGSAITLDADQVNIPNLFSLQIEVTGALHGRANSTSPWVHVTMTPWSVSGVEGLNAEVGVGMIARDGILSTGDVKIIHSGRLRALDSITVSNDYGFEVVTWQGGSNYKHLIRMGGGDFFITNETDDFSINQDGILIRGSNTHSAATKRRLGFVNNSGNLIAGVRAGLSAALWIDIEVGDIIFNNNLNTPNYIRMALPNFAPAHPGGPIGRLYRNGNQVLVTT